MHRIHNDARVWSECTTCTSRFDFDPSSTIPPKEQLKTQYDKHKSEGRCNVKTRDKIVPTLERVSEGLYRCSLCEDGFKIVRNYGGRKHTEEEWRRQREGDFRNHVEQVHGQNAKK
jgi:hypothetical protein